MPKIKQAVTIEQANRNRQSVDYAMKHALNKARLQDTKMLDILRDDAKVTFDLYWEQLYAVAGE